MQHNPYLYILVMAGVSFLIRVLPLTIFRKPIKNRFVRSFLYYVPYVTLAVMTFPAIMDATTYWWVGALTLAIGIVLAWKGLKLFPVAVCCCAIVLVAELLLPAPVPVSEIAAAVPLG